MANLKHRFPLHPETTRVHFEDTRFPECTHADCKGARVHKSAQLMIEQKLIGGWRGPLPEMHRVLNPIGPLPNHGIGAGSFFNKIHKKQKAGTKLPLVSQVRLIPDVLLAPGSYPRLGCPGVLPRHDGICNQHSVTRHA